MAVGELAAAGEPAEPAAAAAAAAAAVPRAEREEQEVLAVRTADPAPAAARAPRTVPVRAPWSEDLAWQKIAALRDGKKDENDEDAANRLSADIIGLARCLGEQFALHDASQAPDEGLAVAVGLQPRNDFDGWDTAEQMWSEYTKEGVGGAFHRGRNTSRYAASAVHVTRATRGRWQMVHGAHTPAIQAAHN